MSNGVYEQLQNAIEKNEIPPSVSNRLVFAGIIDLSQRLTLIVERIESNEKRITENEHHKSLTWYLAHKPLVTIPAIISIIAIISYLVFTLPALFGLP